MAVIVLVVAAAVTAVTFVENAVRRRAIEQGVLTAKIVISLSVDRHFTEAEFTRSALDPAKRAELDADVRILQARGEIVGLEVWDRSGALLYADANHPADETQLPSAELRRALLGKSFVLSHEHAERGVPSLEVFQPADPGRDGEVEGVIEVLLPQSKVDSAVSSSAGGLRLAAGVVVLLVAWVLLVMRRRLRLNSYQAEHDPLTGLGNRVLLARRGATLVGHDDRQSSVARYDAALLVIDLDGFKRVNDALGHVVGDDVLVAVADRLRSVVRAEGDLVRLGGDEFAILLSPLAADDAAHRLAERILEAFREPLEVGQLFFQVGASIGIALRDTDLGLGELLRRGDVSMYQAKGRGCGYVEYAPDTDDNDADHLALLGDVPQAIARDELFLNYQPKIDPELQLTGVEALVRWMHPTRGLLSPGAFLPLVEETGLMKPLTVWVLRRAMAQAASWRADGLEVPIAVNVSPRTLLDADFVPLVKEALTANGLTGRSLIIEITETAILEDPERARMVIQELRACGIGVSIDDFGAGFTSLAHLKRLPISEIKIDQGFVHGLLKSDIDHSIVAYTIRLAHDLGVPVVAEGVESSTELDELRALGCDQFQGFLIAHPLDPDEFARWPQLHTDRAGFVHAAVAGVREGS